MLSLSLSVSLALAARAHTHTQRLSTLTNMEASDGEMSLLLSQIELLHKSYKDAMLDIRKLKARLSVETQKREAAESFSYSVEQERNHLLKVQGEMFSKVLQKLERHLQFEDMLKTLNSLKSLMESKEQEHEALMKALSDKKSAELCALQNQVRQSQDELMLRDAAVAHLEQELSCLQSGLRDCQQIAEKALQDATLKYQWEMIEMKHKLDFLTHEKTSLENSILQQMNMLQRQLQSAKEQQRVDFERRLKESSFSRHSEVYKQKIMSLRKENEDLRRQLLGDVLN